MSSIGIGPHDGHHAPEFRLQVARRLHRDRDAVRQRMLQLVGAEAGRRACREQQADDVQVCLTSQAEGSKRRSGFAAQLGSLHAVAHRGHLGEDRDRDLGRGLGADVEPDRAAQARDLVGRDVELLAAARGARRCSSSSRWRRRRTRRTSAPSISARSSSFGSCVSATSALWPSSCSSRTTSSGMPRSIGTRGEVPAGGVFLARIDHHHVVVEHARHLGEVARELAGADQHQAPARAVHRREHAAVELEHVLPAARLERGLAAVHLQRGVSPAAVSQFAAAVRRCRCARRAAPSRAAACRRTAGPSAWLPRWSRRR